jgi:hypothetical protein
VPIILRLSANAGANRSGLDLGDSTKWENIRSNFAIT